MAERNRVLFTCVSKYGQRGGISRASLGFSRLREKISRSAMAGRTDFAATRVILCESDRTLKYKRDPQRRGSLLHLVAGRGFEPLTFRL